MRLERITDYYKQAPHSGVRPVTKILQKMPNKRVFPLINMKRNPESWGKPTEWKEGPRWTNRTVDPGEYK